MEPAPIQQGDIRPQGRPRHALVLTLLRLIAITGFALAGWIALAALTESASAAQSPPSPDNTPRIAAPELAPEDPATTRLADVRPAAVRPAGVRTVFGGVPDQVLENGERDVAGMPERLREIEDRPVRFLRARRHEVFDGKDRAVRQVRELADAAGVPRVRIPDVRPDAPIVGGLVHDIADVSPVLEQATTGAHEQPAAGDETHVSAEGPGGTAAARGVQASPVPDAFAGADGPGHCAACEGDRQAPGPGLPPGQDHPRGGGSGGHSFAPVADLRSGRYPAAPPAVQPGTFHRTALTDVSAPGGPSVVPD